MNQYEIRILNSGNGLALALSAAYFSDFTAIRAAQNLRHVDQTAQVWRGEDCIYQEGIVRSTPHRPAA